MALASMALAHVPAVAPISSWEKLGMLGQWITLAVGGAMVVLLGVLIWRQLRKRKAPPRDPMKLHRWFREYEYDWATGTAANVTSMQRGANFLVARTMTGTDSRPLATEWTDVSSTTTIFEDVTLLFEGGQHHIHVSFSEDGQGGVAFPVFQGCEGHRITAVWRRRRKGEEHGRYVVFRDWTTARNLDHPAAEPQIHQSDAPIFSFVPVLVLGWIVGFTTDVLPFVDRIPRSFLTAMGAAALWFVVQFALGTIDRRRSDEMLAQALLVIGTGDAAPQDPKSAP